MVGRPHEIKGQAAVAFVTLKEGNKGTPAMAEELKEHVVKGTVDDFPETLQMLFRGENVGKLVLELA